MRMEKASPDFAPDFHREVDRAQEAQEAQVQVLPQTVTHKSNSDNLVKLR